MKKLSIFLVPLLLVACTTVKPSTMDSALDDMQQKIQERSNDQDAALEVLVDTENSLDDKNLMTKTQYLDYTDGIIGNGNESVLFFHATWCPNCRANDIKLRSWYENNTYTRNVYKLDYDTNTDLRAALGVTSQDTFVLIDGTGKVMKQITFPSEAELSEILG